MSQRSLHSPTAARHALCVAVITALSALACDQQQSSSGAAPGGATGAKKAQVSQASGPRPTSESVAIARRAGIPPLGFFSNTVGPLPGPEGSIYYLNKDGLISFYQEKANVAYFSKQNGKKVQHLYAMSGPTGYIQFDAAGKSSPLTNPQTLAPWPNALPIAHAIVNRVKKQQAGGAGAGAGTGAKANQQVSPEVWRMMMRMNEMSHRTNMQIIQNMGSGPCTQYYDGPYYVGCW